MVDQVLAALEPSPGQLALDATVGDGGHAAAILERVLPGGGLIGLDRDPASLAASAERLASFGDRCRLERGALAELERLARPAAGAGAPWNRAPDLILMDLGLSSRQLDTAERGFSFRREGPLDMRMDPDGEVTAADLVNRRPEKELADLIRQWGEDRWARRIARQIARRRRVKPLRTTGELAELVRAAVPGRGRIDPATRTFQALRIAVNGEQEQLAAGLRGAVSALAVGGRLAVIAFHSLEDRLVKRALVAGRRQKLLATPGRQPSRATEEERRENPRSRSAKLRLAVKLRAGDLNDEDRI